MIRIARARMSLHGFLGSPERASGISHSALRRVADRAIPVAQARAIPRVQLTVHAPHGASDAAISARVADAIADHLDHHLGARGRRGS